MFKWNVNVPAKYYQTISYSKYTTVKKYCILLLRLYIVSSLIIQKVFYFGETMKINTLKIYSSTFFFVDIMVLCRRFFFD